WLNGQLYTALAISIIGLLILDTSHGEILLMIQIDQILYIREDLIKILTCDALAGHFYFSFHSPSIFFLIEIVVECTHHIIERSLVLTGIADSSQIFVHDTSRNNLILDDVARELNQGEKAAGPTGPTVYGLAKDRKV